MIEPYKFETGLNLNSQAATLSHTCLRFLELKYIAMKRTNKLAILSLAAAILLPGHTLYAQGCIDFSTLDTGTVYVPVNTNDGNAVLNLNNITARVYYHGYEDFGANYPWDSIASVLNMTNYAYGPFNGNYIWFGNADMEFDLTAIPDTNKQVTFQISGHMDGPQFDSIYGPFISVNEASAITGDLVNYSTIAPGVALSFAPAGSSTANGGTVTLTGNITTVRLGGFEFGVDDFCVSVPTGISPVYSPDPSLSADNSTVMFTTLRYEIADPGSFELALFDLLGNKISVLESGNKTPGKYAYSLDASRISNGIYIVRLSSGGKAVTKKIMLR